MGLSLRCSEECGVGLGWVLDNRSAGSGVPGARAVQFFPLRAECREDGEVGAAAAVGQAVRLTLGEAWPGRAASAGRLSVVFPS